MNLLLVSSPTQYPITDEMRFGTAAYVPPLSWQGQFWYPTINWLIIKKLYQRKCYELPPHPLLIFVDYTKLTPSIRTLYWPEMREKPNSNCHPTDADHEWRCKCTNNTTQRFTFSCITLPLLSTTHKVVHTGILSCCSYFDSIIYFIGDKLARLQ